MPGGEKNLRLRVAANIRRCRQDLNWSQETLALEAGLHRTFIGHVERGETNVSIDNLELIAKAMKLDACEILCSSPPQGGTSRGIVPTAPSDDA
jgi:transcriptional regulator with XRE-family HTH domain